MSLQALSINTISCAWKFLITSNERAKLRYFLLPQRDSNHFFYNSTKSNFMAHLFSYNLVILKMPHQSGKRDQWPNFNTYRNSSGSVRMENYYFRQFIRRNKLLLLLQLFSKSGLLYKADVFQCNQIFVEMARRQTVQLQWNFTSEISVGLWTFCNCTLSLMWLFRMVKIDEFLLKPYQNNVFKYFRTFFKRKHEIDNKTFDFWRIKIKQKQTQKAVKLDNMQSRTSKREKTNEKFGNITRLLM